MKSVSKHRNCCIKSTFKYIVIAYIRLTDVTKTKKCYIFKLSLKFDMRCETLENFYENIKKTLNSIGQDPFKNFF